MVKLVKEEEKCMMPNQKKKPGRPRKNPVRQPQKKRGIVDKPDDVKNHIEFLYDNPELFKKILSYFKSHAVNNIFISFRKTYILFWCEDNLKKNQMRVKINCNMVNKYYCADTLNIGISSEHLEKIMTTIDKTYNSILIISQSDSIQNYIEIILDDDILNRSFQVDLISDHNTLNKIDHLFDADESYTLSIKFPSKKFKYLINNMMSFSDEVSIELYSINEPLMFKYRTSDNKIRNISTFNQNIYTINKEIEDGDTFHVSFILKYVSAISTSLISEYIKIYADENRKLLFVNELDGGCIVVKTITEIIDKRRQINFGAI